MFLASFYCLYLNLEFPMISTLISTYSHLKLTRQLPKNSFLLMPMTKTSESCILIVLSGRSIVRIHLPTKLIVHLHQASSNLHHSACLKPTDGQIQLHARFRCDGLIVDCQLSLGVNWILSASMESGQTGSESFCLALACRKPCSAFYSWTVSNRETRQSHAKHNCQ